MARRKRRIRQRFARFRRRGGDRRISLLTALPVAMKAIVEPIFGKPGYAGAKAGVDNGDMGAAVREGALILSHNFLGYDFVNQRFDLGAPLQTYGMIILGALESKAASHFGANKVMKRIPLVGRYIKL